MVAVFRSSVFSLSWFLSVHVSFSFFFFFFLFLCPALSVGFDSSVSIFSFLIVRPWMTLSINCWSVVTSIAMTAILNFFLIRCNCELRRAPLYHYGTFRQKDWKLPRWLAPHVWSGVRFYWPSDNTVQDSISDTHFAQMLAHNCCLRASDFLPPAFVETLEDYVTNKFKASANSQGLLDSLAPARENNETTISSIGSQNKGNQAAQPSSFGDFLTPLPHVEGFSIHCRMCGMTKYLNHVVIPNLNEGRRLGLRC